MLELNVDWFKENCQMIHYFGLGFIQLKVDRETRFHFYTPELDPIVSNEDVHNHRYDFTSTVIRGSFSQDLFVVTKGDTHILEEESCQEGVCTEGSSLLCGIALTSKHTYRTGSEYFVAHDTFHRVRAENCITMVKRSEYKKKLAEVIRPVGEPKVCPFSRKVDEAELWEIVTKMCDRNWRPDF